MRFLQWLQMVEMGDTSVDPAMTDRTMKNFKQQVAAASQGDPTNMADRVQQAGTQAINTPGATAVDAAKIAASVGIVSKEIAPKKRMKKKMKK